MDFTFWTGASAPEGVAAETVPAFRALDSVLRRWNYRPKGGWCWGYHCRRITNGSGYSLHAYGIAVDINAPVNGYGSSLQTDMPRSMVDEILAIHTNGDHQVFRWGGDWDGRPETRERVYDAMHFEIVASPAELARGIASTDPMPETSMLLWA